MKIIFDIFDRIWRFIVDVFVEESPIHERMTLHIQDRIEHYRVDFPGFYLDRILVACEYHDIEKALELYKYHSHREYVDIFVDIFARLLSEIDTSNSWEVVISTVPMHWTRYGIRWFDHMDYIAKRLARETGIPYVQFLGTLFSQRQSHLSRKKRLENRKNRFTMRNPNVIIPQTVILIDDVISTGATVHECARVFKLHNPYCHIIGVFLSSNISS